MPETELSCPECGCSRFSWMIAKVQYGNLSLTEDERIDYQPTKDGPCYDSNTGLAIMCADCGAGFKEEDDFIDACRDDQEVAA